MPDKQSKAGVIHTGDFNEHYAALFANADLTILEHDIASDTVKPLIGKSEIYDAFPGKTLQQIREIIYTAPERKQQQHAIDNPGTPVIIASRIPGPPPKTLWNQFVYSPVFEKEGREIRLIYRLGVNDMMEARESLEEALRFANIETFEEDAETGAGHFLFGFGDKTGTGFIGGEERLSRIPKEQRQTVHEALQQVGKRIEFQFLETDSPELKWWEQQTIREYTNEQGRRMLVGMARRIHTEKSAVLALKETIAELEVANEAALAAAKSKAEFLANMSHEIRTPLHAILGLASTLARANDLGKVRDLGDKIVNAGQSLQTIINDILDFSKIDAGKLELDNQSFDLQDMLDNLSVIMSKSAAQKDLSLALRCRFQIKSMLIGDRLRLEQVLINLLANAIKFTETGHVILGVDLLQGGARQRLRFSVEDSGIGMSPQVLSKVFNAFEQADSSTSRQYGGTGLGLTISSRLLNLMGTELQVESKEGEGSTFYFEVELDRGEPVKANMEELKHLNVLIADDDQASLDALCDSVTALGWSAQKFDDGEQLVSAAVAAISEQQSLDLLLVDFDMPGFNGIEVAQRVKQQANTGQMPCVLMVSAFSREQLDKLPNIDCVDAILEKPVTTSDLFDALLRLHGGVRFPAVSAEESGASDDKLPLEGLSLLVVDDNEFNRDVAVQVFGSEGAKMICLEDGQQAVNWLKLNHESVDAVLMDIQMPVMDGLEATRQIRTVLGLDIPIAALSAAVFDKDRNAARDAGMNAFISKPFDIEQALETIRNLAKQAAPKPGSSEKLPAKPLESALFDEPQAIKFWGSKERLLPYLEKFIEEYAGAASMFEGLDAKAAEVLAHKVKGTAAVLGLTEITTKSRELMEVYAAEASRFDIEAAVDRFGASLAQTIEVLQGYIAGSG